VTFVLRGLAAPSEVVRCPTSMVGQRDVKRHVRGASFAFLVGLWLVACAGPPTPAAEPGDTPAITRTVQQTEAPTLEPSATATLSSPTPTQAATFTQTPGPTGTPSRTPAVASPSPPPTLAPTGSRTPAPTGSVAQCAILPAGSFLSIWQSDPALQASLGCPTSHHPRVTPAAWEVATAYQPFEHGAMIWSDHIGWYAQPVVYVLHADGTARRFEDTFDPAVDPAGGGETPPEGLMEPSLGFGKVWREQPGVRESLGWATSGETAGVGRFQTFTGGDVIWISQTGQTTVFTGDAVQVFDVPFSGE
jgi:hypothetical protein